MHKVGGLLTNTTAQHSTKQSSKLLEAPPLGQPLATPLLRAPLGPAFRALQRRLTGSSPCGLWCSEEEPCLVSGSWPGCPAPSRSGVSPRCGGADEPPGSLRPPVSYAGGSGRGGPRLGGAQGRPAVRAQASARGVLRCRSWSACGSGGGVRLVALPPSPHRAVGNRTPLRSCRH